MLTTAGTPANEAWRRAAILARLVDGPDASLMMSTVFPAGSAFSFTGDGLYANAPRATGG